MRKYIRSMILCLGIFNLSCDQEVISDNSPLAVLVVSSKIGSLMTTFEFNASRSTDVNGDETGLRVRWDWENDGVWDTELDTSKTIRHRFSLSGEHEVTMELIDANDEKTQASITIVVTDLETDTVTDIDGNTYNTIKIGEQWWMVENLRTTQYRDGNPIPHIINDAEWANRRVGAYTILDNNEENIEDFGLLYNWYTVSDSVELAPEGWHIPTNNEWKTLEVAIGMSSEEANTPFPAFRGTTEGLRIRDAGTLYWKSPNEGATNDFGFSVLPAGGRQRDGSFSVSGEDAFFWASTESTIDESYFRWISHLYGGIFIGDAYLQNGFSVRCVKDSAPN